ncbi:TonB-dependent hemoglobin/transferrin/lactoferrin family receptor [Achromobacter aloeverae]
MAARFRWTPLALAIASTLAVGAEAQEQDLKPASTAPTTLAATEMAPVTVTATRRATDALTTPATIDVIDQTQLRENIVTDFRDALRYEPGIAVKQEPRGRGGEAGIEVRGIGGQRLAMLVDGVRLPNGYVAAGANLGQLKLDPASLSRIEILRGPASSLYGSDALAGVVLFHTLSPTDFLDEGRDFAGDAAIGYDGATQSRSTTANLAFRAGPTQTLIGATLREGHELENNDHHVTPNPQDTHEQSFLLKSMVDLGAAQTLTLTGEYYDQTVRTNQRSLAVPIAGGTRIARSSADDDSTRARLGLAYRWDADMGWFDTLTAQVDYQHSTSRERTSELRLPPGGARPLLRDSLLSYREPQWSGSFQLNGHAQLGATTHRWVAGVDLLGKSISLYNDASQRAAAGGASTHVVDGDVYPRKIAPDTDVRNVGFFVEDEISFGDSRLKLTPSARYDYYRLTPRPDEEFANANVTGGKPVSLSKSAVTPRLGLSYEWQPRQVVYANYVTGFRMPTYDQLNRIGQVPVATFIHDFVPAPNLRPERSRGVELGIRGESPAGSYDLTGFYNRYRDFIDTQMIAYIPPGASGGPRAIRRFQSRNIGEVEIYGVEAKGSLSLNQWIDAADRWNLLGAAQWSMGNDKTNDQPLNSIQPFKLVAGLRWDGGAGRYGAQLTGNFVAGKRRVDRDLAQTGPTAPVPLTTAGYATVDMTGYLHVNKRTTLYLAVYNLFDRRYYDWSMVSGLTGNDARLAAYTAPGRTVSANLRVTF